MQRAYVRNGGGLRRVRTLRGIRKFFRIKYVSVAIAGACGHGEIYRRFRQWRTGESGCDWLAECGSAGNSCCSLREDLVATAWSLPRNRDATPCLGRLKQ